MHISTDFGLHGHRHHTVDCWAVLNISNISYSENQHSVIESPPPPSTPMMTNSTPALVIIPVPIVNRSPGSLKFVLLVPGSLLICLTFDFKNCITSYSRCLADSEAANSVVVDILCCEQAAARPGFLRSGLLLRWGGEAARSGQAFPSLVSVECGYCGAGSRQAAV